MVQKRGLVKIIQHLSAVDKIIILYALITACWIILFWNKVDHAPNLLLHRIGFIMLIFTITTWDLHYPSKISNITRHIYGLLLLSYWYGETYALNHVIFSPFDDWFKNADQWIFGFQPSIEFSKRFSMPWMSEILNFGYFSYFFLNLGTFLIVYIKKKEDAMHAVFMVLTSFFIYYIVFILFPVVGPQFWLPQSMRSVPDGYLFQKGVLLIQQMGEQPTGAFPSSHVGMTLIFLWITKKYSNTAFYIMLPISIVLIFATVYIKAHYAVDVFAGILSSVIVYIISEKISKISFFKNLIPLNLKK